MAEQNPDQSPEQRPDQHPEHDDGSGTGSDLGQHHGETPREDDTQRFPTSGGPDAGGTSHRYPSPEPSAGSPAGSPAGPSYGSPTGASYGAGGGPADPPPYAPSTDPSYERTEVLGFGSTPVSEPKRTSVRPSSGIVVGILAAALVVGGLSGLAGAAGFRAVDDLVGNDSSTSSSTATSPVVNRKDSSAPAGSVEQVAASVLPSVVKINVRGSQEAGSGSGIVISSDGEILTNNHVVEPSPARAAPISVSFNDGSAEKATVVGTDPITDLAVIKAEGVSGLTPATIGKSAQIDVGENVVAIGSPFGLEATVTSGIVSALNRPVSVGDSAQGSRHDVPGDPDRRRDQPRQLRRPAGEHERRSDRHQLLDPHRVVRPGCRARAARSDSGSRSRSTTCGRSSQQLRNGETPTHARLGVTVTSVRATTACSAAPGSRGQPGLRRPRRPASSRATWSRRSTTS